MVIRGGNTSTFKDRHNGTMGCVHRVANLPTPPQRFAHRRSAVGTDAGSRLKLNKHCQPRTCRGLQMLRA